MTIDTTVKRINPPGRFEFFAGGGLAAIIFFSVGVFLMVIPILGWIIGPSLMILAGGIAVAHLMGMFRRNRPGYVGHCPYCGSEEIAGEPDSVSQCTSCGQRFTHHDHQLSKIA